MYFWLSFVIELLQNMLLFQLQCMPFSKSSLSNVSSITPELIVDKFLVIFIVVSSYLLVCENEYWQCFVCLYKKAFIRLPAARFCADTLSFPSTTLSCWFRNTHHELALCSGGAHYAVTVTSTFNSLCCCCCCCCKPIVHCSKSCDLYCRSTGEAHLCLSSTHSCSMWQIDSTDV